MGGAKLGRASSMGTSHAKQVLIALLTRSEFREVIMWSTNNLSILGVLLVIGACDNYAATSLDPDREPQLRSQSGTLVSEGEMSKALDGITREVALAVADPAVRRLVFEALHASPYREHKLHFGTFLRANGAALASKMAQARGQGATVAKVLGTLSGIRDLEFYMPVKDHFATWDGGSNLLVVSSLKDDGRLPTGFNLEGEKVEIASAETPPATPALVLVPVETDFSSPAPIQLDAARQAGGALPMRKSPRIRNLQSVTTIGVVMTYANILDDKEGWPNGSPELEIHTVTKTGIFNHVACSGESRTGDYYYDQDGQSWTGEVAVIDSSILGTKEVSFIIYEDDSEPCKNDGTGLKPKLASASALALILRQGNEVRKDLIDSLTKVNILDLIVAALGTVNFINSLNEDDIVGVANGPYDQCWAPNGPVRYDIKDGTANNGNIDLDWRFGSQRIPVCIMSVVLNGPTAVTKVGSSGNPTPLYTATIIHGSPGVSYEWKDNGVFKTSAASYTMSPVTVGTHTIQVKVTRNGDQAEVTKSIMVTVSEDGGGCPPMGC